MADEKDDAVVVAGEVAPEAPATPEVAQDVKTGEEAVAEVAVAEAKESPEGEDAEPSTSAPEEAAEVGDEAAPEFMIDTTLDVKEVIAKATEVVEKYELAPELQVAFDALKAKAEANPTLPGPLADYGDPETVGQALERDNLVFSVREEGGLFRPNTDQYVQKVHQLEPDKADWIYYDSAQLPSNKYPGFNKFQEGIADAVGKDGEPIGVVMDRYEQAIKYAQNGIPAGDVPAFIPSAVHEAYMSLSRESRDEIARLEFKDEYGEEIYDEADRTRKVEELVKMQRGIEADKRQITIDAKAAQDATQAFHTEVVGIQETFFKQTRDQFTAGLIKDVKFSDDPKTNKLLASQRVTIWRQALMDDYDGEYAREALKDGGYNFDHTKAQGLLKTLELTSVNLTKAKHNVDSDGKQLNQAAFNKATREFENCVRDWADFRQNIIDQEKQLTTGKKPEEKLKVAVKARVVPKGAPAPVKKDSPMPAYKSPEWYERQAEAQLKEQEMRAKRYQ